MATFKLSEFFPRLKDEILSSQYFTVAATFRLPIARTFGYPGEKGWKDYVATGDENPIGYRWLSFWSWPYYALNTARTFLMKSVDYIVVPNLSNPKATPWWGVLLKGLIALGFVIPEGICFLISKLGDKISGNKAPEAPPEVEMTLINKAENTETASGTELQKQEKPGIFARIGNYISNLFSSKTPASAPAPHHSTYDIESKLSTDTHNLHHRSTQEVDVSKMSVFGSKEGVTKAELDNVRKKYMELKKYYHPNPATNESTELKELIYLMDGPDPIDARINRKKMLEKFKIQAEKGSVYDSQQIKSDYVRVLRLIEDLYSKIGKRPLKQDESVSDYKDHKTQKKIL
jgi:hypothetical protein